MLDDPSFKTAIAAILERVVNGALNYDPASRNRLSRLDNTTLQVQTNNPDICFLFQFAETSVRVSAVHEHQASDVSIKGDFFEFIELATKDTPNLAKSNIEVSGKVGLLEDIKNILHELDIDWEAAIADIVGSIPGHAIAETIRLGGAWLSKKKDSISESLPQILIDELELLPSETELKNFYREVDELNAISQRVQARIERLQMQRVNKTQ